MRSNSRKIYVMLALIGIGGLALNFGMMTYMRKGKGVSVVANANALARQALETLTINGYGTAISGSDCVRGQFARMWTVDTYPDEKRVEVTVSWPKTSPRHVVRLSGSIPRIKAAPAQRPAVRQPDVAPALPQRHSRQQPSQEVPAATRPAPRL